MPASGIGIYTFHTEPEMISYSMQSDAMPETARMLGKQLLYDAVDRAPESMLWVDPQGHLSYANRKAMADFGLTAQGLRQVHVSSLIPELDDKQLEQIRHRTRVEGSLTLENRVRNKSLRLIPVEIRVSRQLHDQAEYLMLYLRNIVARNEAERLLQLLARTTSRATGEAFFQSLARSLADALNVRMAFVTECLDHPATRVRSLAFWLDDTFTEPVEYELAGTPCDIVINESKVCYYPERLEAIFPREQGLGVESYLGVPIFNAAETRVIGHIALLDAREMPENFYIKTVFDIFCSRAGAELERLQTTRTLQRQEEKYRLLVENQRELVTQLDPNGAFEFVSPSLCELIGKQERELLGRPFLALIEASDRKAALAAWDELETAPYHSSFEHRARTTRGWRWLAWSLKASLDDTGALRNLVCVGRDVTARRRAEEKAHQTLLELAHLSRLNSMGEMASAFAHEVNQPLCAILSFSQACQRMLKSDRMDFDDLRHAIDRMAANAELAGNIIRQMRSYVKKGDTEIVTADLAQLVRDALTLAQAETKDSRIAVNLECEAELPSVKVNVTQIQQVMLNLLRNAAEAVGSASPGGRIDIVVRHLTPSKLQVSVCDNGPGIQEGLLERLFEPFVTSKRDGIGIGLSICNSIIEAHGGSISAGNLPHAGACFRFSLPISPKPDERPGT
jgi:PAS domain S-box-containing protein